MKRDFTKIDFSSKEKNYLKKSAKLLTYEGLRKRLPIYLVIMVALMSFITGRAIMQKVLDTRNAIKEDRKEIFESKIKSPLDDNQEFEFAPEEPVVKVISDDTFTIKLKQTFGFEKVDGVYAWQLMKAICMAESGCQNKRSYAQNSNGTYDWGVFQINDIHRNKLNPGESFLDEDVNFRVAGEIFEASGPYPWVTYWKGLHKEYL